MAQASEAPLLAVIAALIMASSARHQAAAAGASSGRDALPPDQPAAPVKMRKVTVSTSSALPRWIATDQGLLRSSTVSPPRAPWTRSRTTRAAPAMARSGRSRRRRKVSTARSKHERADEHARDQAMHPLQHDLGIAVADVGHGREVGRQWHPVAVAGGPVRAGQARIGGADHGAQDDQGIDQDRGDGGGACGSVSRLPDAGLGGAEQDVDDQERPGRARTR